jgi:hypothetical protein
MKIRGLSRSTQKAAFISELGIGKVAAFPVMLAMPAVQRAANERS